MALEDLFDIGQPIHVGQIATSYPATRKDNGDKVLLKVIHPQLTDDPELVERFRREGEAMLSVEHPCVVQLLDFGEEDGIPYLALEWVDGGTLDDQIASGPLPQDRIERLASDMLSGLSAVHTVGLLHRDLKPDNILLTREGSAKLADFSLVGYENFSGLTQHGALVGSPAYMAPELIQGKTATVQSDLYGIGIILLEALTGSNPLASNDPMVSLELIRTVVLPKLSERTQINRDLARMIDRLVERDPGDRPASAETAISGEQDEQKGAAIEASKQQTLSHAITRHRRNTNLLLYGIWIVGIVMAITSWWIFRDPAPDSKNLPEFATPMETETVNLDSSVAQTAEERAETVEPEFPTDEESIVSALPNTSEKISTMPMMPKPGRLTIIAIPWAQVSVDYEPIGVTPIGTLELTPGGHYVQFDHILYPSFETEFIVKEGKTDTLIVHMSGEVNVIADPYGFLIVNGEEIGWLPGSGSLILSPGMHWFEVTHPELENWTDSVNIVRGRQTINIDLTNGTMIAQLNSSGLSK